MEVLERISAVNGGFSFSRTMFRTMFPNHTGRHGGRLGVIGRGCRESRHDGRRGQGRLLVLRL